MSSPPRPYLAPLVIGLWLGLLLASWVMASVNFRTADRVLGPADGPEVATRLAGVAPEERRAVLRHLASEINRWMFRTFAAAQVPLAALVLALCWRQGGAARVLAGAALAISLAQAAGLVPAMRELGRSLDFLPRPLPAPLGRRFGLLHGAYVGLDLVKALALAVLAVRLAPRS